MYGLLIVLVAAGATALLYLAGGFRGTIPYARISPLLERRLAVLPLAGYAVSLAVDLVLGDGSLAFYPVLPAAAIFYMILVFATRRLVPSFLLSAAIVVMANLPSPLL